MGQRGRINLESPEETISFGASIGKALGPNSVLALTGELGAGKTTFVQGLLDGLSIRDTAQSPTFTYLQIYEGKIPVYHFDLYRLKSERDFVLLGFEEFLFSGGIAVIEWPERIASLIPPNAQWIGFSYSETGRFVECKKWSEK